MDAEERERQILKLQKQVEELERLNLSMHYEIKAIKTKIEALQNSSTASSPEIQPEIKVEEKVIPPPEVKPVLEELPIVEEKTVVEEASPTPVFMEEKKPVPIVSVTSTTRTTSTKATNPPQQKAPKSKSDWERFIGENLINKIGILITVIGVGIGTKYAIDHELISIEMRIILGYLLGGGLLALALKLKAKYAEFSAVLLSGSMAIFYFLTFISYSFYHFFPIALTFGLMALFTAFTVLAAVKYDRVIIAHLGLVGAYGIPFLLSDGSGKVGFFYSYIAVINIGILVISYFKNWKSLQYAAYGLTWFIFLTWYGFAYQADKHFHLAILFLLVFFLEFYAIGLVYKVLRNEKFAVNDIFFILGNSFLFFALGYNILAMQGKMDAYLGLFCVFNALIHFAVSVLLYTKKLVDKTILYLVVGMVMLFVTITIPVQFEGNVVTITWSFEALMLFVLARYKKVPLFEWISYPVFVVALMSLVLYWIKQYGEHLVPGSDFYFDKGGLSNKTVSALLEKLSESFLFNAQFLTSFCFLLVVSVIYYLNKKRKDLLDYTMNTTYMNTFHVLSVIVMLLVYFVAFWLEIDRYFSWKTIAIKQEILKEQRWDLVYNSGVFREIEKVVKLLFILLYFGIVLFVRTRKNNSSEFNILAFTLSSLVLLTSLLMGIYLSRMLHFAAMNGDHAYFSSSTCLMWRLALLLMFGAYFVIYLRFVKRQFPGLVFDNFRSLMTHAVVLLILSFELILFWDVKKLALDMQLGSMSYGEFYLEQQLLKSYAWIAQIALLLTYTGTYFFLSVKKAQTEGVKYSFYFLSVLSILLFLIIGLYNFSFLQLKFLFVQGDMLFVLIRYIMFLLFAAFFVNFMRYVKQHFADRFIQNMTEFILHVVLIWVISSELVNWMHVFNSRQVYKLTLSIFWGIYAMGLVSYGIWKRKTPLRIGAISLFGLTLVKLFLYDLVHLSTLAKTVVFIVLGLLLLGISFLYNRYKTKIFGEDEK